MLSLPARLARCSLVVSRGLLQLAVVANQRIRRTIMASPGFFLAAEFRDDAQGQHFAELDAPLIERVDVPDRALGEHIVLVESDELAERSRGQPLQEDRVGRPVSFKGTVRHEPAGRAFGADLLRCLAKGQRFALRENVGQQHVMLLPQRIQRLAEGDEVAGDEARSLVDQLIKRMLAVGAGLAPVNRARIAADGAAVERPTVCAPKKLLYQTARSPISTGKLRANGAVRKCSSIS